MNDREIAVLVWLAVLVAWAFAMRDVRQAFIQVLKTLLSLKLLLPLLALVGYLCALAYVAQELGLWDSALTTDTVVWFIGTGLVLFGKTIDVFKRGGSVWSLFSAAVGLTVFVEVFVNLYVFPLPVELILVPLVSFLAMMSVVAGTEARFATIKKLVDGTVGLIGIVFIIYVTIKLATGWNDLDRTTWQRFALPIWMTLGVMPFLVCLGLYSNYDTAFSMIRWASDDRQRRRRARVALITGLHLHAREVGAFNGMWCKLLTRADSLSDARAVVRRFRERWPDEAAPSIA